MARSRSGKEARDRPLCKAVRVEPKLQWSPRPLEMPEMGVSPKKAAATEANNPKREDKGTAHGRTMLNCVRIRAAFKGLLKPSAASTRARC